MGRCVCEQNEKSHPSSKVKGPTRTQPHTHTHHIHTHALTSLSRAPHKHCLRFGCDPVQWLNWQLGSDLHLWLSLYSVFLSGSFFPVAAAQSSLLPLHWMTSLFCLLDTLTVCLGMWGCTEQVWPECESVKGWEEDAVFITCIFKYLIQFSWAPDVLLNTGSSYCPYFSVGHERLRSTTCNVEPSIKETN